MKNIISKILKFFTLNKMVKNKDVKTLLINIAIYIGIGIALGIYKAIVGRIPLLGNLSYNVAGLYKIYAWVGAILAAIQCFSNDDYSDVEYVTLEDIKNFWNLKNGKIAITTAEIKTDVLKNVANNYKVTIGGLLTSLMIYSLYVAQKSEKKFLPIKVAVPVNLRYFYPSKTLANFTTFITPGIINSKNNYEFSDVVNIVKQYLKDNVKEEKVNRQFSKMVALEKNPFIHIIPLFIKNPIMRYIYLRQNRYFSSTFSNLGNVILPDEMSNYVSKVDFMLGQASIPKSIGSCVSYNNKTIINISRTVKENKIEKVFFETLEKIGVMSNVKEN
mgnify:CR=1 FL=1